MSTFALIHGAWGSGWHWASIPERLRAAGHDVVAPDLPCDDPSATAEDYAAVVLDALGDADDVVVAAFSLGGLTAVLVADRRPVRALVHLAAVVPEPGLSLMQQLARGDTLFHPDYLAGIEVLDEGAATRWVDPAVYRRVAYDDAAPEALVRERFDRLRPQATAPFALPCSLDALPPVPTRYVMCTNDRLLNNEHWRGAVDVTDEVDSPHQLMVSQPDRLTELLLRST